MKPLRMDFAPMSVARTVSRIDAITCLTAIVGLGACIFFGVAIITVRRQHTADTDALQRAIAQQKKRVAQIPVVLKPSVPAAEIIAVNTAIEQLNLPWRDVLDAIERATPADIALLSLEPDAGKHRVKGTAEARDSAGMIAYLESLQQQEFFTDVELARHETNETDTHKPLRFQFEAHWKGRAP